MNKYYERIQEQRQRRLQCLKRRRAKRAMKIRLRKGTEFARDNERWAEERRIPEKFAQARVAGMKKDQGTTAVSEADMAMALKFMERSA